MPQFGPVVPSAGPLTAKMLVLGEAPGTEESSALLPFVGPSGWELRRMLRTIGVNLDDCYTANVFSRQPADNNLALYGDSDLRHCHRGLGPFTTAPITYCHSDHLWELDRLYAEIAAVNPNVVLALGNTACWALGLGQGIGQLRGSVHTATIPGLDRPLKVLPTFHPAAILRQWDLRVVALADLEKAHDESHNPSFAFDNTELWLQPSLQDLVDFGDLYMAKATVAACDIETKRGQITCLSFAPTSEVAIVIPFWVEGESPNYWARACDEATAWRWVIHQMERADLVKVGQNFLYDLAYLQAFCSPRACTEDTMLAHHSMFSELPKGLGWLGSLYANVPSWKKMRTAKREEQLKRDD